MEVQIISKKLVKPSIPTPSHRRCVSLSLLDQILPPRTVPCIFYYSSNGNYHLASGQHVERQKQLEKSLAEVLTLYYPLAGRYVKENQLIDCNDEGVEYIEALVNGQLSQILRGEIEPKELTRLVPDEVEEFATSALVAIQINTFNCGGLAIGLRVSHTIIDGFTFFTFTDGWAKASKVGINDVTILNFVTGSLFPSRDLSRYMLAPPLSKSKTDQAVTKRFVFDANIISKVKVDQAMRLNCKPSIMELLTALIWRAQVNAATRARHGQRRTSLLSVLLNLRHKKFKAIIPENCGGNLWTRINARFDQANESKMGNLNDFVDQVMGAIRNSIMEYAKQSDDGDVGEFLSKVVIEPYKETLEIMKGEGDICVFSDWRNFPSYEMDFGWGKPAWVSSAPRPHKGVCFIRTKDNDGIEAWVTMEENEMAYFQSDPDIIMFLKLGNIGDGNTPIPRPKM